MSHASEPQALHDRALARWDYLGNVWRRRALRHKVNSIVLTCLSVTLAVAATVLAATPVVPKWVVAIISGGTALATALLVATKSQEHWVIARSVQNQLHAERFLYEQRAGRYAPEMSPTDEARLRLFSERITEIALAGHNSWATQVVSGAAAVAVQGTPASASSRSDPS